MTAIPDGWSPGVATTLTESGLEADSFFLCFRAGDRDLPHPLQVTTISILQWSLGPHSSTPFKARTSTESVMLREANT